jgi:hypothetical protein
MRCLNTYVIEQGVAIMLNDYSLEAYTSGTYCSSKCAYSDILEVAEDKFQVAIDWVFPVVNEPNFGQVPIDQQGDPFEEPLEGQWPDGHWETAEDGSAKWVSHLHQVTPTTMPTVAPKVVPGISSPIFESDQLQDILAKDKFVREQAILPKVVNWDDGFDATAQNSSLAASERADLFLSKHSFYSQIVGNYIFSAALSRIGKTYKIVEAQELTDVGGLLGLPSVIYPTSEAVMYYGIKPDDVSSFEENINTISQDYVKIMHRGTLALPFTRAMNLCVEVDGEQAYFRIILQNARMRMIVNAQKTYDIPIAKISLFNHIKDQFKDEYQKLFVDSYKQSDKFDYIKQVEEFFELVKNHLDVMPEADPIVEAFNLRISDITTVMKDIIKDNSGIPVLM